jgi:hypothetical protein
MQASRGDLPAFACGCAAAGRQTRLPLGDRRLAVQVEVQQLPLDVALALDDLGLPVVADAVAAQDRRPAAGLLGADQVRAELLPAALEAGNPEAKAQATIESGLRKGLADRPSQAAAPVGSRLARWWRRQIGRR